MKKQTLTVQAVQVQGKVINVFRTTNNSSGNPRYIVHFLELADTYEKALKIAHKIGGRKHMAKNFGGGIVFQSYNIQNDLAKVI